MGTILEILGYVMKKVGMAYYGTNSSAARPNASDFMIYGISAISYWFHPENGS